MILLVMACHRQAAMKTVWTRIMTDEMSVLIWIQTIWNSDSVPERMFGKNQF